MLKCARVGCVIQLYMPPTSAIGLCNPYTKTVVGRGVRNTESARFIIMWTKMSILTWSTDFKLTVRGHCGLLISRIGAKE